LDGFDDVTLVEIDDRAGEVDEVAVDDRLALRLRQMAELRDRLRVHMRVVEHRRDRHMHPGLRDAHTPRRYVHDNPSSGVIVN
jgi:hypothetical protein